MILTGSEIQGTSWEQFVRDTHGKLMELKRLKPLLPVPPRALDMLSKSSAIQEVAAHVNHGRWIVDCPFCHGAEMAWKDDPRFFCFSCFNATVGGNSLRVNFPGEAERIEEALMKRPLAKNRSWNLDETVEDLLAENAAEGVR